MNNNPSVILTPTAPGELIDKITVLKIKRERITDPARLVNVNQELALLEEAREKSFPHDENFTQKINQLEEDLKKANEEIWDMGDKIREFGAQKDFGEGFAAVALGIHFSNDHRAAIKREINLLLNSPIIEEKSYKHWK